MTAVRHDALVFCVRDRYDGRHDDDRERGKVPPLYLARPWIIKISSYAEAWMLRARCSLMLSAQTRISSYIICNTRTSDDIPDNMLLITLDISFARIDL